MISWIKQCPPYLASFCPACGVTGGAEWGTQAWRGMWPAQQCLGAWPRLVFEKKTAICPTWGFQGLQLVEAAWLEQRVHWWGGSQICYTRAPSASWHRGLAGKTCGPELGVGLGEGTGLCLQSWWGWGTRQARDSIFETRQSAHLWNNSWYRQGRCWFFQGLSTLIRPTKSSH